MKKILLVAFAVILLVLAGGVFWFMRSLGFTEAAKFVPADTVALVSLPDLPRAAFRWPQTILAQIGAEPQVQAFLEKPFHYVTKDRGGNEATDILFKLKPVRMFAAVVKVSPQETSLLLGFQFWGGAADHDAAIARLRQELDRGNPVSTAQKEIYNGDEIVSTTHQGKILYTARHGHWGFLSNNPGVLKDALDRASGRVRENSLNDNPRYHEALARLVTDPDFFVFIQPQSVVDTLLAIGGTMGAQAIPRQVDEIKKIEALSGAMRFDGPNLHDSIFILRHDASNPGSLTHRGIKLTTSDTTIYFDFLADFAQLLNMETALAPFLKVSALQTSQLPALIPEAFGPECAVSMRWKEMELTPHGVAAVQVRDAAKAEAALQEFLTLFPQATITDTAGTRAYTFPSLQYIFINPAFALANGFLLIGLAPSDIQRALTDMSGTDSLEKSPAFTFAQPEYQSANEVFGFVDTQKIFSSSYPMLRQVMIFSSAVMPGVTDLVDASKLPETATIARHLQPIVYAQTRFKEGLLIESKGPITMNLAALLGAAAAVPFMKPLANP